MAIWNVSCTIIGAGSVTATARLRASASATIAGAGSVSSPNFISKIAVSAKVAGQGSVTAHANVIANAHARIFGSGFVVASLQSGQAAPIPGGGSQFIPGETTTPTVDDYVNLIPGYNADQPKFISTLRAVLDPLATLTAFLASVPDRFDLDTAIGVQLDQVGLWIGRNRLVNTPISNVYFSWDVDNLGWEQGFWQGAFDPDDGITQLDDGTYRSLLYAKAMSNVWDSNPEAVGDMLNVLLKDQGVSAVVIDNQNMSMSVQIVGGLQNLVFRAILEGGYLPIKPEGVSITYTIPDFTPPTTLGANITGFGFVTAHANVISRASANIQGQGTVIANAQGGSGTGIWPVSATLSGAGSVSGTARVIALAKPNIISGAGSVTANAQGRKLASATILGAGSVTANANVLTASTQTWSTTLHETWIALSNQNFTATKTGNSGIYSPGGPKIFKAASKWYWEVVFPTIGGDLAAGLCNASLTITADAYLGSDTTSAGWYQNGDPANTRFLYNNADQFTAGSMPYYAAGDVCRFALDGVNWNLWMAVGTGSWNGTNGGDPATNVGGWAIPTALQTGGVGPAFVMTGLDAVTAHFKSSDWAFAAPTGYGAM